MRKKYLDLEPLPTEEEQTHLNTDSNYEYRNRKMVEVDSQIFKILYKPKE
jgi:hypothetical protein